MKGYFTINYHLAINPMIAYGKLFHFYDKEGKRKAYNEMIVEKERLMNYKNYVISMNIKENYVDS